MCIERNKIMQIILLAVLFNQSGLMFLLNMYLTNRMHGLLDGNLIHVFEKSVIKVHIRIIVFLYPCTV